jgi:hypothetical protein
VRIPAIALQLPIWVFNSICLFLLISDAKLFTRELSMPSFPNELEKIGSFSKLEGEVKKNNDKTIVWLSAKVDENTYLGDTIFTGVDSRARIKLKESVLELEENSVIKLLKSRNEEFKISLLRGKIKGKVKNKIKISYKSALGEEKILNVENLDNSVTEFNLEAEEEPPKTQVKPIFFENIFNGQILTSEDLNEEGLFEVVWSDIVDDKVLKLEKFNGEEIFKININSKNREYIKFPKINLKYVISIVSLDDEVLESSELWLIDDSNIIYPQIDSYESKVYGVKNEAKLILRFTDYNNSIFLEYGNLYINVKNQNGLDNVLMIDENALSTGYIEITLQDYGVYDLDLSGEIVEIEKSFSQTPIRVYFLPKELKNKIKLMKESIEHEINFDE